MRGVFVTATDTGVGKTVISAGLAWALRKRNQDVGVMKPFATSDRIFSRKYRSSDVAMLAKAVSATESDIELNPSFYPIGASPMMAASLTRRPPPNLEKVLNALHRLMRKHKFIVVEGIGGIMVPLTSSRCVADFAKAADLPVIVVARSTLGTLNHTIMTINACKSYGLRVAGLVVNMMSNSPGKVEKSIPRSLTELTGVPVLAIIPRLRTPTFIAAGKAIEKTMDLDSLLAME